MATKRRSIFEQIAHIDEQGDEASFEMMESLEAEDVAAVGFRASSASTQARQDRILECYERFVLMGKRLPKDLPQNEMEQATFPSSIEALTGLLRQFLIFVARYSPGRHKTDVHISYRTLVQYRTALMFWARRKYQQRDLPDISMAKLHNKLTEAMASAAKKYGMNMKPPASKTWIGLAELRQLIDMDTVTTMNMEFAEGQHLAWCIGRICAVRPGSIGPTDKAHEDANLYLTWRDIEITKGAESARWSAVITFRSVKTDSTRPETLQKQGREPGPIICHIEPPQREDNLVFSVVHRLLIIALRRGLLVGIQSLKELFESDKHNIIFKSKHLDDPVIFGSGPRGLSLSNRPAEAGNISRYLQVRGKRLGYSELISFYSIRRRAATDLAREIGVDAARLLLGHSAESRTLERYYLNLQPTTDVSALNLGETVGAGGQSSSMIKASSSLAHHALSPEAVRTIHGSALNALTQKMIASDPNYPFGGSGTEKKNYRRRASRAAFQVLLSDQIQKQRQDMTNADYEARVAAASNIKLSAFLDDILSKAREKMKVTADDESVAINSIPGLGENGDFEESGTEPGEEDLELLAENDNHIVRRTDELADDDGEDYLSERDSDELVLPYDVVAYAFMEVLLTNEIGDHKDYWNNPVPCSLCEEDDTVKDSSKEKSYKNPGALRIHMESYIHTPAALFQRTQSKYHDESGLPVNEWTCPYCMALESPNGKKYTDLKTMMNHVKRSSAKIYGAEHEELKRSAGWFEPDWSQTEGSKERSVQKRARSNSDVMKHYGIKYSTDVELLESLPHPELTGVVMGGPSADEIPDRMKGFLKHGDPKPYSEIPYHLEAIACFALPNGITEVPEGLKEWVSVDEELSFDPARWEN